jgi:signal transduction histidine kinase
MKPHSARPGHRSRTAFVGVLLVGALALSAALAWQAIDAGRSHEAVARETVEEQARFAVWEFTNTARRLIGEKVTKPGLDLVLRSGGKGPDLPLVHPSVDPAIDWSTWTYGEDHSGAFFRVELDGSGLAMAGPDDPALRSWIETRLAAHVALNLGEGWSPVVVDPGDGAGLIVYRTWPEGEVPERVFGYRLDPAALAIPLGYAFDDSEVLPESLTRGRANAELFSVSLSMADGTTVWSTPERYSSTFEASDTLGRLYAGLTTALAVDPAQAESMTIGGFPSSRLPTALGLLILTGGLVAAAFFQLRRESELGRLRADFVSGVSHELRTPLAQIRMFAETLLLGRVRTDEERVRSLRIIVNEAQRLTHQVDNVLLYSKAERRALPVSAQRTDVGLLVAQVAEAFQPLAEKAGATLRVETTPGLEARVDGELVRQALLNLLDNASKYGPSGQTVEIGAGRAPGGRMVLWVEDQGPGVAPDERDRIWEPYFRLEHHRESAVAGSGIGLSVVRQIVDALGGAARVEAGAEGGARFVLEIPIGMEPGAQRSSAVPTGARARSSDRGTATPEPAPRPAVPQAGD